jgi:hypothetical protein
LWFGRAKHDKQTKTNKGVCHIVALPFTNEKYLNAKEELKGNSNNFTMQKI